MKFFLKNTRCISNWKKRASKALSKCTDYSGVMHPVREWGEWDFWCHMAVNPSYVLIAKRWAQYDGEWRVLNIISLYSMTSPTQRRTICQHFEDIVSALKRNRIDHRGLLLEHLVWNIDGPELTLSLISWGSAKWLMREEWETDNEGAEIIRNFLEPKRK